MRSNNYDINGKGILHGKKDGRQTVYQCNLEAFKEWEKVQKNAQNNTPSEEKE